MSKDFLRKGTINFSYFSQFAICVTMSSSIIILCSKSKLLLMLLHEYSYYDSSACHSYTRA